MKKHLAAALTILAVCFSLSGCVAEEAAEVIQETVSTEAVPAEQNLVRSKTAVGNSFDEYIESEPFTSYSYDFTVYDSNYMITAAPDETMEGLTLTVEDNTFGFSTFHVAPPANYSVALPYSQEYASQVCTVIKSSDEWNNYPDLLKIDFYLSNFEEDSLPYTVSRLYSILGNRLVEVEVYDTTGLFDEATAVVTETPTEAEKAKLADEEAVPAVEYFEKLDYIPESYLYQTEPLKFMPAPAIAINDETGQLSAEVVTYTLNPDDMTMRRAFEPVSTDTVYFGYAAHAVAGYIYQYFIATSLNVTDYENYIEIPSESEEQSRYFFKVDDPRFHTVQELRDYVSKYFSEELTDYMFANAPQKYRDIDGELYTILGDGGYNETLGKLTITDFVRQDNVITYHTKQEKFNENHEMSYIDGGDFIIELRDDGSFIVTKYRYPSL
ncbi:MAG: hypothetical protein K2K44_11470 [Oscillospiraceae bacterium]|nr:hypothetical protein [Oscillospiraceae bacterium]